ncbi:MAG: WhiB family redox-sensing transcriptional regulator [Candidatus Aldehydirespiratoraceae bacterium]|jgi:WhiB family redox-sensing transcriptional regulator
MYTGMSSLERADREPWQHASACSGEMSMLFYPPLRPEKGTARLSRESRAKAVCANCSVAADCLQNAIANDERYGIWGGLTYRERRLAAPPAH